MINIKEFAYGTIIIKIDSQSMIRRSNISRIFPVILFFIYETNGKNL